MLAAAADYAVTNHWALLKEDHDRARRLAEAINSSESLRIDMDTVETNILIFETLKTPAKHAVELLKEQGILMAPFGENTIRATLHLDIDDQALEAACRVIRELF